LFWVILLQGGRLRQIKYKNKGEIKMQVFVKKRMVYVFAFLVLFLAALSYPVAVKAEAGNYYLSMGEYLSGGMRITSLNGKYFAMMQTDGNFVIYQSDTQKALWHTNTYGGNYTSYRAMMQTDGNFVVYGIKNGAMTALWNAGTHVYGSGTYRLELGDDSVLRVKKNGNTVWNSPNAPINSSGWSYMFTEADNRYISSGYKLSERPDHYGIDIISTNGYTYIYGDAIRNVSAGNVVVSQALNATAGNYVVVETNTIDTNTNKKIKVRYLHMKDSPSVTIGQIAQGTIVGYVGNTGDVSPKPTSSNPYNGTHLHFDVNNQGKNSGISSADALNPQKFFPGITFLGKTSTVD
jgi:murein DD-endopeptidase MepM/ murein hydrolase activator NlpD